MRIAVASLGALALGAGIAGCAHAPPTIAPVAEVDLERFMGDWYVIGNIPTRLEREAFNARESYVLDADGAIRTTFEYRDGSFEAPVKTLHPVGRVRPGTRNAVWGMQFVWPIEAEYVIVDLDPAYRLTIIGRSQRDYAWIMARTPRIADSDYAAAVQRLKALGYSTEGLRRVPQRWPDR
ncbi:lipocalin family protein [Variovorax sp. J22P168]|nr:lipocalin family protein [Variovorax sp. J22P168]